MGVAEEWEEMEEYSQQMDQMKRQVSSLTDALSKIQTRKTDTAEDDCQSQGCGRPIDWYCRYCKFFICTRCSKKDCGNQDRHEVTDVEEMYQACKLKYSEWKGGKESTLGTLTKQQKKLQDEMVAEIKKMAAATSDDMMKPEMAKIVSELPAKRKLLEDVTKQVKDAGTSLSGTGIKDIDRLSQTEFIKIFDTLDLNNTLFEVTDLNRITLSDDCELITKETCYDLDVTPTGDVLMARFKGFDVCDKNGKIIRSVPITEGSFTSIQYYKGKIYALLKSPKGTGKRQAVVYDAKTYSEVTRWQLPNFDYVSMLAVSNDKVYVVDSDNKKVKVYSLTGEPVTEFQHSAFVEPTYMSCCPPDGVLLTDWSKGIVYKIECSTDKIAWQWDKVKGPRGVYCDKLGNVWVWCSKEQALFLRSADGKTTKKFDHANLKKTAKDKKYITGMFLADGQLWCAACGDGVIRVQMFIDGKKP